MSGMFSSSSRCPVGARGRREEGAGERERKRETGLKERWALSSLLGFISCAKAKKKPSKEKRGRSREGEKTWLQSKLSRLFLRAVDRNARRTSHA